MIGQIFYYIIKFISQNHLAKKKNFCWHWIKSAETISSRVFSFKWLIISKGVNPTFFHEMDFNLFQLINHMTFDVSFCLFVYFVLYNCFFYNLHIQQLLISTIVSRDMYHLPLDNCDVKTEGHFPTWHEKNLTSKDLLCKSLGI